MGGAVSAGEDNEELVDNLVEADYVKTACVESALRAVDRGNYYLDGFRDTAYKDLAWKNGNLHLSAPCIYSEVLECLKLAPGQSFLNLGSGTGYLSTVAGLLLGTYGVNHGVEQHTDVVDYANERLAEFLVHSSALDLMEFAKPYFVVGNCLQLDPSCSVQAYDRVYCGAAVPPEHLPYIRNMVKVGGIAVMPSGDQLLQIQRVTDDAWETKNVLPVSFATLSEPSPEERANGPGISLPDRMPLELQEICRETVRRVLRKTICEEHPDFKMRSVLHTKKRRRSVGDCATSGGSSDGTGEAGASRRRRRFIRRILIPVFRADSDDEEDEDLSPPSSPPAVDQQETDGTEMARGGDGPDAGAGEDSVQAEGSDGAVASVGSDSAARMRRLRRPIIAIGTAGISRRSSGRLRMEDLRWNRFYVGGNSHRESSPDEGSRGNDRQKQPNENDKQSPEEDIRDSLDFEQQLLLSGAVDGDGHSTNEEQPPQVDEQNGTSSFGKTDVETENASTVQPTAPTTDEEADETVTSLEGDCEIGRSLSATRSMAESAVGDGTTTGESSKRSHSESEVPEAEGRRKRAAASAEMSGVPPACRGWRDLGSEGDSDASDAENEKHRDEQRRARQENVNMQKKFTQAMAAKIASLPVPDSIKAYLNYYRNWAIMKTGRGGNE